VQAATITYVGSQLDIGDGWRTPAVTKPLDPDGDNIIGSDGYFMFNTGYTGSTFRFDPPPFDPADGYGNASVDLPSFVTISDFGSGGSVTATAFSQIDDPLNPGTDFLSGTAVRNAGADGAEVSFYKLTFNNAPAEGVRVGVLVNNAEWGNAGQIRFELDSNPLITVSANTTRPENGINDFFFFDFEDLSDGDTFSFYASDDTTDNTVNPFETRFGGFTFAVIPEPGTLSLLGIAAMTLSILRLRKR
jgi:hypothetical protein